MNRTTYTDHNALIQAAEARATAQAAWNAIKPAPVRAAKQRASTNLLAIVLAVVAISSAAFIVWGAL